MFRNFLRSLQWRLVFIFISISIVLVVVIWVFLTKSVETYNYNKFAAGIEDGFKRHAAEWKDADIQYVVEDLKYRNVAKNDFLLINKYKTYTIFDKETQEIVSDAQSGEPATSEKENSELINGIYRSENFISVLADEKDIGNKAILYNNGNNPYFDYARELMINDKAYIFYFRYYREEFLDQILEFNRIIINGLVIAIIASLLVGYAMSRTITVPIIRLMHRARRIASGDFDQVLEVKSQDEIGALTNTFNYMAIELKRTLNEISREKNKVETLLNYMTDGIIAFDMSGDVIHINPAAKKMLDLNEPDYKFTSFCEKYGLDINLEEITYLGDTGIRETSISFKDKFLRVYFVPFVNKDKNAEGLIAVLQDITEQQKLENSRKEFVANVSHELRTPLTSIKSYTETLLDGMVEDTETAYNFLKVIDSEADRMTRIVKDLLQLSRMDNKSLQLNKKWIRVIDLVKECIKKVELKARGKKQDLENYVIGEIPLILADHDRIEQVVLNILSNAINYTPEGGSIVVYVGRIYSDVYIKVEDTGIGIPEADLERIFERFYRVDKARSRELGGTGLGLSIVKDIVELHGGHVSIKSAEGQGTEVTVTLPVNNTQGV